MSEYLNVEKPFLEKLRQIGWEVIDHGAHGIPGDPTKSLRNNFKEVVLEKVFKESVRKINLTEDGKEWLTEKQLDEILTEITDQIGKSLHEANKAIFNLLLKNTTVDWNEITCEQSQVVMNEAVGEQLLYSGMKDMANHAKWMKASEKFDKGMELGDKADAFLNKIKIEGES